MLYTVCVYVQHAIVADDGRDARDYADEIIERLNEVLRTEFLSEETKDTETAVDLISLIPWEEV